MKRYFVLLSLVLTILDVYSSEFSVLTGKGVVGDENNNVFVFESMNGVSIRFSSDFIDSTGCRWYKYTDDPFSAVEIPSSEYSTDSSFSVLSDVSADCGYIVEYGDSTCDEGSRCRGYVWSTLYKPISDVSWNNESEEVECESLSLKIVPAMMFVNKNGMKKCLKRNMTYSYSNFLLSADYKPGVSAVTASDAVDSVLVITPTPAVDTRFKLTDAFASLLSISNATFETDTFMTDAVVAYPIMTVDMKYDHEVDPNYEGWKKDADGRVILAFSESFDQAIADTGKFKTSAPVTIDLMCYPSENVSKKGYVWEFVSGINAEEGDFTSSIRQYDSTIVGYKFVDPGLHCIKLTVASVDGKCESSSYGCFRVADSGLWVPNAFTPNGDGSNDEFRVAYRSIVSFECRIYDQWGKKVYDSNDITEGWNGKIGGRKASVGVYFYVIEARGADGVKYKKKGAVNLIRGK